MGSGAWPHVYRNQSHFFLRGLAHRPATAEMGRAVGSPPLRARA